MFIFDNCPQCGSNIYGCFIKDAKRSICKAPSYERKDWLATSPTGDWKPETPCYAMAEVFVKEIRGDKAVVLVGNEFPIFVPLSSIRPIRKEGE